MTVLDMSAVVIFLAPVSSLDHAVGPAYAYASDVDVNERARPETFVN